MAGNDINIKIVADTKSLDNGLKKAEKGMTDLQKKVKKSLSEAENSTSKAFSNMAKKFNMPMFDKMAHGLTRANMGAKELGDTGEASGNRMASAFAKVGTVIAGALAGAKILEVGKECLEAGAFAQEMQNKFEVVFQKTGMEVDGWCRTFGNSIGRSNTEIKDNVSNLGDLLEGYGMTEEEAGSLSESVVALSYDLA